MQHHCDAKDKETSDAVNNYFALFKDWEKQCEELKFANKLNNDTMERT